jgi:hypothetical protein
MIKLVILFLAILNLPEPCDTSSLADECVKQMPRKFSVLKTFPLIKKKEPGFFECSYVFTSGTKYNIGACFKDNALKIELYNSRRTLVASAQAGKKKFSKLNYKCVSSGIYYVRFLTEATEENCGATLISFSKAK